jgi:TRAP-type mannitol/chloroaromatic compound transport system permease small subunit
MQMPHTLLKGRHIRSEIIINRLNVSKSMWLELLSSVAGALVFIALFVASWPATITSWEILEYEGEGALRVPVYPIRSIILLGSALTAIIFMAQLAKTLKEMLNIHRRAS